MTTTEESQPEKEHRRAAGRRRPVLLSALCLFSFASLGILSLLFLAGLFNSGWITDVMNQYIPLEEHRRSRTVLFFLAGSALHLTALAGSILMWRLRRTGYYLLGLSCLLMAGHQLFNPAAAVSPTALYIALVIIFGLFYSRLE